MSKPNPAIEAMDVTRLRQRNFMIPLWYDGDKERDIFSMGSVNDSKTVEFLIYIPGEIYKYGEA